MNSPDGTSTHASLNRWFASHPRHWRESRLVYPVISRRAGGLSIGINVNPDKLCNFRCVYCCVDREQTACTPNDAVDLNCLRDDLTSLLDEVDTGKLWADETFADVPASHRKLVDLAFSGDGEPTLYPHFLEALHLVTDLKRHFNLQHVKLVLITNATQLHRLPIQRALSWMDQPEMNGEIWAKLDAGSQSALRMINKTGVSLDKILDNILQCGRVRPIVIQSIFINDAGQDPSQKHVQDYVHQLRKLVDDGCQIKTVQLYTLARPPADSQVQAVSKSTLDAIAKEVTQVLPRLDVQCYAGIT